MNVAQKTIDELKNHEMELRKRLEVAENVVKAAANSREENAELKRLLAIREKDAERLVRECEKFDELESKLTQQITDLRKENDELKTQIGEMNVQVQPNLHSEQAEAQIESLKAEIERLEKANGRLEKVGFILIRFFSLLYKQCR
ncbi:hypothetical protein OESDEN_09705 [Oesophagostomum dentatum]|uniref:Uncharacterized protein n=1 Tax=Oesophagostomum dentatum TaxID=61180 RepID=A0A0B1SZN3_OESDE|nr:hypothetical protein OESDEN_09705 [Oesophagostomum dentatum]